MQSILQEIKNKNLKLVSMVFSVCCFVFLFALSMSIKASTSIGTIDSSNYHALVCHDPECGSTSTSTTPGIINFLPTGLASSKPVTIQDTGITGYAWGNELGWINFKPTGGGLLLDAATGKISGQAWSQVSGWINFSPTGSGVTIDANGQFTGWAWTGGVNGGWIKFDCSATSTCVKTDWRPTTERNKNNKNDGVVWPLTSTDNTVLMDICVNLPGLQTVIPPNFIKDAGDFCVPNVDLCYNLPGIQIAIPQNYIITNTGECLLANPAEEVKKINKKPRPIDYCVNLPGLQTAIPKNFILDANNFCIPASVNYCPNLQGQYTEVPEGMEIDDRGNCVPKKQPEPSVTPTITEPTPLPTESPSEPNPIKNQDENLIYGFSFIDKSLQIPVIMPKILGQLLSTPLKRYSGIDLTSVAVAAAGIFATLWALLKLFGVKAADGQTRGMFDVIRLTIGLITQGLVSLYWLFLLLFVPKWGTVFDGKTQEPVKGAKVTIYNSEGKKLRTKTTNKDGKYCFRVFPGQYYIKVEYNGFMIYTDVINDPKYINNKYKYKNLYYGGKIPVKNPRKVRLDVPIIKIV